MAQDFDGLNSLNYRIVERIQYKLFTHFIVDLNFRFPSEGIKRLEEINPSIFKERKGLTTKEKRRLLLTQKFQNRTKIPNKV